MFYSYGEIKNLKGKKENIFNVRRKTKKKKKHIMEMENCQKWNK